MSVLYQTITNEYDVRRKYKYGTWNYFVNGRTRICNICSSPIKV